MAVDPIGILTKEGVTRIRSLGYDPTRMVWDDKFGPEGFTELTGYDEVTGEFITQFTKWNKEQDYFRVTGESVG